MTSDIEGLISELREHVRYRYMPASAREAMERAADTLTATLKPQGVEAWAATVDRIVPAVGPISDDAAKQYPAEWAIFVDRDRIRRELLALYAHPQAVEAVALTPAEIQSGQDRVRWAESLILQMPDKHDGRNSWLLNYGIGPEAVVLRDKWISMMRTNGYPDEFFATAFPALAHPQAVADIEKAAYQQGWNDREADFIERAERIAPQAVADAPSQTEVARARQVAFTRVFDAWEAWDTPDDTPDAMIDAMNVAAHLFFVDPGHKQEAAVRETLSAPSQTSGEDVDGLPWSDCKVAFGADDKDAVWRTFCGPGMGPQNLPPGWSLCETDASGARLVAVFRVDGPLRVEDGAAVCAAIAKAEGREEQVLAALSAQPSPTQAVGDVAGALRELSDASDEINGKIDKQIDDDRRAMNWEVPDDHAYSVELRAGDIRRMDRAICEAQRLLALSALAAPKGEEEQGLSLSVAEIAATGGPTPAAPKAEPPGPVNCTHVLRREGRSYPRTCERCGLGPCPFYDKQGARI